jgi:CO/xanthine dehydrogenase FAD-binding subunit
MRSNVANFEMIAVQSLAQALERVADGWVPFAGGTDLMVLFEAGKLPQRRFVSIWKVRELRGIAAATEWIEIGTLATYTEIQRHPIVQTEFPLLVCAAKETGGVATQNRGTIGGNICNASPAADSPPALLVYDAQVELVSKTGSRWVDYAGFHTGYKKTVMRPDEILARIRLPRITRGWHHYYRKVGARQAQAISKVCFAGTKDTSGRVRIALGSVAPTVLRCPLTESAIQEGRISDARAILESEIAPIDDIRSTALYRRRVAGNLLEEFLSAIM